MMDITENAIARGRRLSTKAGQLLNLMKFQTTPGGRFFSYGLSTYDDMLDPTSSDAQRLEACRKMLCAVRRRAEYEGFVGEAKWRERRRRDPYGLELRTSRYGATLEMIADVLADAIAAFQEANKGS